MAAELAVVQWFAAVRTPLLTSFFTSVTAFGSVTGVAAIIIGILAAGHRETAFLAFVAAVSASLVENVLNLLVRRPRPPVDALVHTWTSSFPSGHAALAFALAPVLSQAAPSARIYLYLLAALIAISRVYLGAHYPSDVVAGAAVGLGAGLLVVWNSSTVLEALSFLRH
ncbi:MAG: phosphatase PAP2 family protein [Candidatus Nanohaloarchaea archaeon]|nr:phosphatase PAP2 family protein [Candidatus Nanohaloarchaea archaeon]